MNHAEEDLAGYRIAELKASRLSQYVLDAVEADPELACFICRKAGDLCREKANAHVPRGPVALQQMNKVDPEPRCHRMARWRDNFRRVSE